MATDDALADRRVQFVAMAGIYSGGLSMKVLRFVSEVLVGVLIALMITIVLDLGFIGGLTVQRRSDERAIQQIFDQQQDISCNSMVDNR